MALPVEFRLHGEPNAFLRLPVDLAVGRNPGVYRLHVSFGAGDVRSVLARWNGEVSVRGFVEGSSQGLLLRDEAPPPRMAVERIETVPAEACVPVDVLEVEACEAADYAKIMTNAGVIERELFNQLAVLEEDAVFPIFLSREQSAWVRVLSRFRDGECGRLKRDTRVVVRAPRPATRTDDDDDDDDNDDDRHRSHSSADVSGDEGSSGDLHRPEEPELVFGAFPSLWAPTRRRPPLRCHLVGSGAATVADEVDYDSDSVLVDPTTFAWLGRPSRVRVVLRGRGGDPLWSGCVRLRDDLRLPRGHARIHEAALWSRLGWLWLHEPSSPDGESAAQTLPSWPVLVDFLDGEVSALVSSSPRRPLLPPRSPVVQLHTRELLEAASKVRPLRPEALVAAVRAWWERAGRDRASFLSPGMIAPIGDGRWIALAEVEAVKEAMEEAVKEAMEEAVEGAQGDATPVEEGRGAGVQGLTIRVGPPVSTPSLPPHHLSSRSVAVARPPRLVPSTESSATPESEPERESERESELDSACPPATPALAWSPQRTQTLLVVGGATPYHRRDLIARALRLSSAGLARPVVVELDGSRVEGLPSALVRRACRDLVRSVQQLASALSGTRTRVAVVLHNIDRLAPSLDGSRATADSFGTAGSGAPVLTPDALAVRQLTADTLLALGRVPHPISLFLTAPETGSVAGVVLQAASVHGVWTVPEVVSDAADDADGSALEDPWPVFVDVLARRGLELDRAASSLARDWLHTLARSGLQREDLALVADRICALASHAPSVHSSTPGPLLRVPPATLRHATRGFAPLERPLPTHSHSALQRSLTAASRAQRAHQAAWDSLGALEPVKRTLLELVELPTRFRRLFAQSPLRLPSNFLLAGPPGTGKTALARALASRCGLQLVRVKGPELLGKYVGSSEAAVRAVFRRAAAAAPALLFFDELEALAPRRGAGGTGVTDRVVNQLLTFLDGVETTAADGRRGLVVVAGASSRPDLIDPALLRPGRLDQHLILALPGPRERAEIMDALRTHAGVPLDTVAHTALPALAACAECDGFSGADLEAWIHSAVLLASAEGVDRVAVRHLQAALMDTNPSVPASVRARWTHVAERGLTALSDPRRDRAALR